ncbi:MAG: ABC transporter substrate-binding protein [Chloroflexota bacterium]
MHTTIGRLSRRRLLYVWSGSLLAAITAAACSAAPPAGGGTPSGGAAPAAGATPIQAAPTPAQIVVAQSTGSAAPTAAPTAAPAVPTPAATAAAASAATARQKQLVVAVPNSAPTPWPYPRGAAVGGVLLYWSVWEGLYGLDNSDNPQWVPQLATAFSFSDAGKTFDFTMRPNVKWHNGDPVTADDAVWSLNTFMPKPYPAYAETFDAAEKIGENQVRIHLKKPDGSLVGMLAWQGWILPQKYFEKVGEDGFAKAPIGSGPYRLTNYVQDDYYEMEPFEGHWRGRPYFDRVTVRIVPEDATRIAMAQSGEADVIWGANPRLFEQNRDSAGLKGIAVAGGRISHYQITASAAEMWKIDDPALKPWTDERVRQAANYAINRPEMVKQLWLGQVTPVPAAIAPTVMQPAADIAPYEFDPQKAKDLLTQAGYPNGFQTFIVEPATPSYVLQREMAQAVANYLTQVGITTQVKFIENGKLTDMQNHRDQPENVMPLLYRALGAATRHPSNKGLELRCPADPTDEGTTCDPRINGKFVEGKAILDPQQSTAFYQTLDKTVHEAASEIFLWEDPDYFIMRRDVDWKIVGGTTYRYNLWTARRS